MKISLLILATFLLGSCQQYRYDVTYVTCSGGTGTTTYTSAMIDGYPVICEGRGYSLPTLCDLYGNLRNIRNVCDFSYTSTPIN